MTRMTDYEFRVKDWARFQHYKKKTEDGKPARRPTWIKVYTKLLDDPNYVELTGTQRGLLHDVWLWWARMDLGERYHRLNVETFNRLLASNARISTWKALETAGFLEIRAITKTGLNAAAASPEVEGEEEKTRTTSTRYAADDPSNDLVGDGKPASAGLGASGVLTRPGSVLEQVEARAASELGGAQVIEFGRRPDPAVARALADEFMDSLPREA